MLLVVGMAGAPRPAEADPGEIVGGSIAGPGWALIVWDGGDLATLTAAAAAQGCAVESVWSLDPAVAALVGYRAAAPPFVNQDFLDLHPGAVFGPLTPLMLGCGPVDASLDAPSITSIICERTDASPGAEVTVGSTITCVHQNAGGAATSFAWSLTGEAAPVVGAEPTLSLDVRMAGTHTVSLRACNPGGCSEARTSITVLAVVPEVVSLDCSPAAPALTDLVQCEAVTNPADVYSMEWTTSRGADGRAGPDGGDRVFRALFPSRGEWTVIARACAEGARCSLPFEVSVSIGPEVTLSEWSCNPSYELAVLEPTTCHALVGAPTDGGVELQWTASGKAPARSANSTYAAAWSAPGYYELLLEDCVGEDCDALDTWDFYVAVPPDHPDGEDFPEEPRCPDFEPCGPVFAEDGELIQTLLGIPGCDERFATADAAIDQREFATAAGVAGALSVRAQAGITCGFGGDHRASLELGEGFASGFTRLGTNVVGELRYAVRSGLALAHVTSGNLTLASESVAEIVDTWPERLSLFESNLATVAPTVALTQIVPSVYLPLLPELLAGPQLEAPGPFFVLP